MIDRSRAWVEVDFAAIELNACGLTDHLRPDRLLMAVVKADAYGHGLTPTAKAALRGGARWLGVATTAEGEALRSAGIAAPVALLCAPPPADAARILAAGLTAVVGDDCLVDALAAARGPGEARVHLDVDTGMGRSGIAPERAVALWRRCAGIGLTVDGLCTHFADADGPDPALTERQWALFEAARSVQEAAGARFSWIHAGNSAATLRYPSRGCNLARPGLLLYGLRPPIGAMPGPEPLVRPALSLRARVAAVRALQAGSTISYGATCRLARPSRVATVLVGYGDGYPLRLSSRGAVLIRGRRAPILGRVCMDQLVADVTGIPGAAPGDIATCIGTDGPESITAEEIAAMIDTTEHEITACLTARLPRVQVES